MPDEVASQTSAGAALTRPDDPRPPRHIVLLSDGTGNSRGKAQQTNVWRVYEALDLKDPSDLKVPRQFALYDDGVGSSSFKPIAILGGVFGFGLARNVRDLYAFLCRTWRPGDCIYAFGFSRGAFTIRVLVGLVDSQGIVKYDGNEAELHRLVKAAYRAYRKRYRLPYFNYVGALRWLRDTATNAAARLRGKPTYTEAARNNDHTARIEFLGLWDTVDAYGVPVDELGVFVNNFIWPFQMPNARLSDKVDRAVHALALDDERNTFHPKLWDHDATQPQRISQVWFAGMHSDVGGGYADKGLAHVSLKWVVDEAQAAGLRFIETIGATQQALSDENGPMNDSRRGIAGYYRYNPRRLHLLLERHGIERPLVHESVLRRIRVGQDAYAPIVLPPAFDVLPVELEQGEEAEEADRTEEQRGERAKLNPPVPSATYLGVSTEQQHHAIGIERVFNRVWMRRVIYFATVAVTLLLVAQPLFRDPAAACTSSWCGAGPAIRALNVVLPAAAASWTDWYANHPGTFMLLAMLAAGGLVAGGIVQRTVFDNMRRVWYAVPATRPSTAPPPAPERGLGVFDRAVLALRTAAWYRAAFKFSKHILLPGALGLVALAVVLVLVNGLTFTLQVSGGSVCPESRAPEPRVVGPSPQPIVLDTQQLCAASGLQLERGGTYEVVLHMPRRDGGAAECWCDLEVPANLRGIAPGDMSVVHRVSGLMKREMSQPWLQPMLRVGSTGADVQPLLADPSVPLEAPLTTLRARIVARSSGELFLYVNDAVGPPGWRDVFQRNNLGTASGTIRLVRFGTGIGEPPDPFHMAQTPACLVRPECRPNER